MASAMAFVACEQEKVDLGTPSITLSVEEVTLEAAGGETTVDVTATRDWTVTLDEESAKWLVVDPASGEASATAQTVTVSALSNEDYDREASVAFTIGMQTKYLTVKQAGAKGAPTIIDGEGTEISPYSASKAYELASALGENDKRTGVYVQGIVKEIKEISTQYGNATYYITDEVGTIKFYVYRGSYLAGAKFTSEDQLKVGDNVVICGDLMNFKGDSPQLGQGNYIVKLNEIGSEVEIPESKGKKTVAEFLDLADEENYYELTGIVSNFNSNYCSFDIKDESGSVYVYSLLTAIKSQWVSKIANGGTITIYGKYFYYDGGEDSSKAKDEVIDAYVVNYTAPEGGEDVGDGLDPNATWAYRFAEEDMGTSYSGVVTKTFKDVEWTFTMTGSTYLGWDNSYGRGLQMGKKAEPASEITLSTSGVSGNIKKIVVNTSGASNTDAELVVKVGETAVGLPIKTTTTATAYTFEAETAVSGAIELKWTLTKAAVYINSIAVYTE